MLWSMRFSSAFVQLFTLVAASVTTTGISGVMLIMSFVFVIQFSSIPGMSRGFRFLRYYVIAALVTIVLYQVGSEKRGTVAQRF